MDEEDEEGLEDGELDFISRQLMQNTGGIEGSGTDTTTTATTVTTAVTTPVSTCTPGLRESGCSVANFERCATQSDGSNQCQCLNGYSYDASGTCVASTTVSLVLAFLQAFQQAFLDLQNPVTQRFIAQLLTLLQRSISTSAFSGSFLSATVRSLRQGSIISDIEMNFDLAEGTVDVAALKAVIDEQLRENRTNYDGLTYFSIDYPPNSTVSDPEECSDIRLNYCSENATCSQVNSSSFSCSCNQGFIDDSWNGADGAPGEICVEVCTPDYCLNGGECKTLGGTKYCQCPFWFISERCELDIKLIILVVGSSVGLLVVVVGVCCCVLRRRERRQKHKNKLIRPTTHDLHLARGASYRGAGPSTLSRRVQDDQVDDFGLSGEDEARWVDIAEALSPGGMTRGGGRLYPQVDSDTLSSRGSSTTGTARVHLPRQGELFGRPAPRGELLAPEGLPFQFPHLPPAYQGGGGDLPPPHGYMVRRRSSANRVERKERK